MKDKTKEFWDKLSIVLWYLLPPFGWFCILGIVQKFLTGRDTWFPRTNRLLKKSWNEKSRDRN